jgi:hypothetical protein
MSGFRKSTWSGLRESNPSSWLGKPEHYHYAKPALETPQPLRGALRLEDHDTSRKAQRLTFTLTVP